MKYKLTQLQSGCDRMSQLPAIHLFLLLEAQLTVVVLADLPDPGDCA
jgi:hypothetical protein